MAKLTRHRVIIAVAIFLLAFGVRVLSWHDTRLEVGKVQTVVTEDYKRVAELLKHGGVRSFFSSSSPLADPNNLGHPPGYSIFIVAIRSILGDSDTAIQFVQITFDALGAVLILLIVAEFLPFGAAVVAGLLAAFSPQLAWNSVLLLPDSLAIFPILLAVYLLALSRKHPRLLILFAAGALVGVSCWLRANAMVLSFFLAATVLFLSKNERRWRYSLALLCGTFMIVLPLTVRNAVVFHRFIPLSLGAGQTLLEGISDYDQAGRFNIPNTDMGIMKQESEMFQRPDYYGTLFNPDGVERERGRLRRGFAVIRSHPAWFLGVMIRRAGSMIRLERARLISVSPPVSHSLSLIDQSQLVATKAPADLFANAVINSRSARTFLSPDGQDLIIEGDDSAYGTQITTQLSTARGNTDYALALPIKVAQGRVKFAVIDAKGGELTSTVLETAEHLSPAEQQTRLIQLAFVATADGPARLELKNEASNVRPLIHVGTARLYELGPARFLWTRYPRLVIRAIQKLFLTAIVLPLAIAGLLILIARKRRDVLLILSVVPVYYFCVQSVFHTEYRYVLAVNYFVFAFAAAGIAWFVDLLMQRISVLRRAPSRSSH